MNSDNEDQEGMSEDQKRLQTQANRKDKKDTKESSHPMATRGKSKSTQEECVAGGTRVTTGSGRKDTLAANGRPSKT
jgi:hypothetical protein